MHSDGFIDKDWVNNTKSGMSLVIGKSSFINERISSFKGIKAYIADLNSENFQGEIIFFNKGGYQFIILARYDNAKNVLDEVLDSLSFDSVLLPYEKTKTETFIALVMWFYILFSYIFGSLCVYKISRKLNIEPSWLAWVPLISLFLISKMANFNYKWWLAMVFIGILHFFMPNPEGIRWLLIFILFFYIFASYRIIIALKKPGWMTVFNCIPFIHFVAWGYLAFSE